MHTSKFSLRMGAVAASLVASTFTVALAHASTYDAASGFSSSNAAAPWSYGTGTVGTGAFTPMSQYTGINCLGLVGVSCWQAAVTSLNVPIIAVNRSPSTIDFSTVVFPTGLLLVHPGQSTDSIVEWTAPAAGTYTITGFFELLDVSPTGVVASVYNGTTQLFTGALSVPGASFPNSVGLMESFSLTQTLAAGSVLSFGVNNFENYLNDSTGFDVVIANGTPEPGPMALVAAGFVAVALFRRDIARR